MSQSPDLKRRPGLTRLHQAPPGSTLYMLAPDYYPRIAIALGPTHAPYFVRWVSDAEPPVVEPIDGA